MRLCALFLLVACSCTRGQAPARRAPDAQVSLQPGSAWELVRGGSSPVFRAKEGGRFLYAFSDPLDGDQHNLPGLGFGDARGPSFGLLSGHFAPLVVFADPAMPHPLAITATASTLHVMNGAAAIDVRAASMTLRGAPYFAFPADRTETHGTLRGASSFALTLSAGDRPGTNAPRADRVEVGAVELTSAECDRPLLVHPVPRGSTSVFLVRFGPVPNEADPLFFAPPIDARAAHACSASVAVSLDLR